MPTDTVPLALLRHPAESPAERIGSLVVNYGGPGESGVDYLRTTWSRLPTGVRARFDVVSFDPRGTGASRPIDCVDDAFLDLGGTLAAVPDDAAQLDACTATTRSSRPDACSAWARTRARSVPATSRATSRRSASRSASPSSTTSATRTGRSSASRTRRCSRPPIRTMVLDGPPDYWLRARDYAYQQARGFMDALTRSSTGASRPAAPSRRPARRATCCSSSSRASNEAPLPATYTADGVTREGDAHAHPARDRGALDALRPFARLADPGRRPRRRRCSGGSGAALLQLADQYLGRRPDGTGSRWSRPTRSSAASTVRRRRRRARPPSWPTSPRSRPQLPPWGGAWATTVCVGMPKPAKGDALGDVTVRGAPPILVIGTTGDPATPYAGAQAMVARIAGSQLLTFDSTEHTALRPRHQHVHRRRGRHVPRRAARCPPPGAHCAPD